MSRPIKLEHLEQAVQRIDEVKQDQITGRPGQVVGFGEDGRPKALDLPGQEIEFATAEEVEEMLNAVFGQSVLPPVETAALPRSRPMKKWTRCSTAFSAMSRMQNRL